MSPARSPTAATLVAAASLVALTALTYLPIRGNEFIRWDDDALILENPLVSAPLGVDTVTGAFSFGESSYWQPLTFLSFAVDRALFGLDPVAFHAENVAWHTAAALVLFAVLVQATGVLGRSFVVAALFAVHPLNVESVAWAVERRNVLAAFFGLLAVLAYVYAVQRRRVVWHAAVMLFAALSLLAKALLLPLPGLLLALDVWPLKRIGTVPLRRLILEKLPLAALCAAAAVVVSASIEPFRGPQPPLSIRLANAVVAPVRQLAHAALPIGLSPFYEYPRVIPAWQVGGALVVLAALIITAWRLREQAPYLLSGGAWFVAALVPTLGLVQAGAWPALADRHAYIAVIGVLVAATWGAAALLSSFAPVVRASLAAATLVAAAVLTAVQVPLWRDSLTVLRRAVQTAPTSAHVRYALGTALVRESPPRLGEGIEQLELAVRLDPSNHLARTNVGIALKDAGHADRAFEHLAAALRLSPDHARAHVAMGALLLDAGRYDDAAASLRRGLALAPLDGEAYANLGMALNRMGRFEESIAHLTSSPGVLRRVPQARFNLGVAYAVTGRTPEARAEAHELRAVAPNLAAALEAFIDGARPSAAVE